MKIIVVLLPIVVLMPKIASAILNPKNQIEKNSDKRITEVVFLLWISINNIPVSLFPTPGGPDIARTSGSALPDFLLNSHPAIELVIASSALFWPPIIRSKLSRSKGKFRCQWACPTLSSSFQCIKRITIITNETGLWHKNLWDTASAISGTKGHSGHRNP